MNETTTSITTPTTTETMDTTTDDHQQTLTTTTTSTSPATTTSPTTTSTTTATVESSPSRPQRTRRMPSYYEDFEMDVDLRRMTFKQSAMSSPTRKPATPRRSTTTGSSSSSSSSAAVIRRSSQAVFAEANAVRQRRQERLAQLRNHNDNDDGTTMATATATTAVTTTTTTTTRQHTYVNPLDRFTTVQNTAADAHNRFREYQSAGIDEEEAVRQLLNEYNEAQSFRNELIVGTVCRHKWAIGHLLEQQKSQNDNGGQEGKQAEEANETVYCMYTPSIGGSSSEHTPQRKLTLDQVLNGCRYHPGKIHNPEQKPTVEIVFSFDATGSMFQAIDELKRQLSKLMLQLMTDLPSIRIAIIAHGDYCDHDVFYTMTKLDFTNDIDTLVRFVQTINMCGGGDPAECYEMAIKECGALSWYKSPSANSSSGSSSSSSSSNSGSVASEVYDDSISRVLVMIGDDVPHAPNEYFKIDWRQELKSLYDRLLLKTYGIQALYREYANEFYQELADMTYGTRLELENFSKMHELVLALCYRESAEHASIAFASSSSTDGTGASSSSASSHSNDGSQTPAILLDNNGSLSDADMLHIHYAIHDINQTHVTVQGTSYEISVNDLACRFVRVEDVVYIEQNKQKNTKYAQMANEGHKVTWITHKGAWGLIVDDAFVRK